MIWKAKFPIENRIFFVTGASAGIGRALVLELLSRGAKVGFIARRSDKLTELQEELKSEGWNQFLIFKGDVQNLGDVKRAISHTYLHFGGLHGVIANAGFGVMGRIGHLEAEDFRRQFETNIFGVLNTITASLTFLRQSRGQIVLLGSTASYVSLPGMGAYAMSKFALRAYADTLRAEEKDHGVGVTLINPGFVDTEFRNIDNRGHYQSKPAITVPEYWCMSAEKAAHDIVKAMIGRKHEVAMTWYARAIIITSRWFPGLMRWAISFWGLKARGEAQQESSPDRRQSA
jgi:short-subunit dehydrogenase